MNKLRKILSRLSRRQRIILLRRKSHCLSVRFSILKKKDLQKDYHFAENSYTK